MQQPVPIELLTAVLPTYDFVLIDESIIFGPSIAADLYDAHTIFDLRRKKSMIDEQITYWGRFTEEIASDSRVHTTHGTLEQLDNLYQHFQRMTAYHHTHLQKELRTATGSHKYVGSHRGNARGKRRFNHLLETTRRDAQVTSAEDVHATYTAPLYALQQMAETLQGLTQHMKEYNPPVFPPPRLPGKVSENDAILVTALLHYLRDPSHTDERGTIITADGDIIVMHNLLLREQQPASSADLIRRSTVSFYDQVLIEMQTKTYNPNYGAARRQSERIRTNTL